MYLTYVEWHGSKPELRDNIKELAYLTYVEWHRLKLANDGNKPVFFAKKGKKMINYKRENYIWNNDESFGRLQFELHRSVHIAFYGTYQHCVQLGNVFDVLRKHSFSVRFRVSSETERGIKNARNKR